MLPNDSDSPRPQARPRANTTTFSAFGTWRKQVSTPSAPAPPVSPPLQLEELIKALTPPAVPSLAYARALATSLSNHSPIPRHAVLNPILASLCAADAPVALKCAGYDILSAYCENPEAVALTTSDRIACFSLFLGPGGSWGTEIWEPRFKALRALTKSGAETRGIETAVLGVLKGWISNAFDSLVLDLALDRPDRAERERSIGILAEFLTAMVGNAEFMARISEDELVGVLHFYAGMVEKAMDMSAMRRPSFSSPALEITPNSSPARPFQNHRRNPSSASIASSISSPPVTPGAGTKVPTDIAIATYITHLNTQLKILSSTYLDVILPFLFRALAHCSSPLPRLSVSSQHSRTPSSETKINELLYSLLSGTYASTSMVILRKQLYPPRRDSESNEAETPKTVQGAIQTAIGAQRTLRNYIRRALSARLARAYISRETSAGYSHSGAPAHMEIERDLMERAWPSTDSTLAQSGWDAGRLGRPLSTSALAWVAFGSVEEDWTVRDTVERVLDEIAGTLKDVFQEVDERNEDNAALTREEAAAVGKTLFNLAEYLLPLKNPDGTPLKIILDQPNIGPSPFLRSLTSLLNRDHAIELQPLLSRILLHVADHLDDIDTTKLPSVMASQNDLTPISPEWLENWETLLKHPALVSAQRGSTRQAVMRALESVHDNIRDMPSYRRPLAQLVIDSCKRITANGTTVSPDGDDCDAMWKILGEEIVFRTAEEDTSDVVSDALDLLFSVASASSDVDVDESDTASVATAGTHSPAPHTGLITPATAASPILSRMQSDAYASPTSKEKDKESGLPSVMSSFISSLTSGSVSRQHSFQPSTPDLPEESGTSSPISQPPPRLTCDVGAVCALILVFSQLSFTPHALERHNLEVAVRVFQMLLQLLEEAKSARIRLTILQFMMRLRGDRDHRLYYISVDYDAHGLAAMLGGLINRVVPSAKTPQGPQDPADLALELRTARPRIPQERDGRRQRGRGGAASGSGTSRSRSRLGGAQMPLPSPKPLPPMWGIPETLLFTVAEPDTPSEGLAIYDPGGAENGIVLPISLYLKTICGLLEGEHSWEVLSYILVHLPNQLANKHMFCGPNSREQCANVLKVLCQGILKGWLGLHVERFPGGLKVRDAHGLAFHTLSVLVGYQPCFDSHQQHLLVEVFQHGLDGQPATIKCCLHALSLAAFELTGTMTKCLSRILEKLSQIMSNADVAVHILGLLSIIGSRRQLYANFTDADFKMVFGVALQYLQHHNRSRNEPTSTSWALSEHVRILSYYIVYVWFLAIKLPDRHKHVPYITRQLLLANEGNAELDGSTVVCFDWLERYTYASADPRPATSLLGDIVMNPAGAEPSEEAVAEKTWGMGNSFVTLRTLRRRGWFEVLSRRPSGYTKLLCRLENVPMVGPGDVDPDVVSVPAALVMEREPSRLEDLVGQEDQDEVVGEVSSSSETIREIFVHSGASDGDVPPPDPLTGYVWSGSAPSQRRKQVEIHPSFIALQLSDRQNPNGSNPRPVDSPGLAKFFASLDRIPVIDTHKVGIMYVAPGQSTELEILGNTHGSPAYTRFLEGIGRLINLRGQLDVYAGGLDPEEDGEYAYAWWDDIGQILYHTATMMPSNANDPQLTNKKRHIGNDYVRIVWNDSGKPYRFDTLTTQFQFVNIVIEPHSLGAIAAFSNNLHENEYFKITVQRAPNMPEFAPVGPFKLISAKNLPRLVRQLGLLADWFASVFAHTQQDTERVEIMTNWHSRLNAIRRFQSQLPAVEREKIAKDDIMGQEATRDFTTAF